MVECILWVEWIVAIFVCIYTYIWCWQHRYFLTKADFFGGMAAMMTTTMPATTISTSTSTLHCHGRETKRLKWNDRDSSRIVPLRDWIYFIITYNRQHWLDYHSLEISSWSWCRCRYHKLCMFTLALVHAHTCSQLTRAISRLNGSMTYRRSKHTYGWISHKQSIFQRLQSAYNRSGAALRAGNCSARLHGWEYVRENDIKAIINCHEILNWFKSNWTDVNTDFQNAGFFGLIIVAASETSVSAVEHQERSKA